MKNILLVQKKNITFADFLYCACYTRAQTRKFFGVKHGWNISLIFFKELK